MYYYKVLARIKLKTGNLIGYRLLSSTGEKIDITPDQVNNFKVINAIIDKNGRYRAKPGKHIDTIEIENAQINSRRTPNIGKPMVITHSIYGEPSGTQNKLLKEFETKDILEIDKKKYKIKVEMKDLAVLTSITGVEYALFERSDKYIIIKGNINSVYISSNMIAKLLAGRYNWIGHTHPGINHNCLTPSDSDYNMLSVFGNKRSVIYNSVGQYYVFERED